MRLSEEPRRKKRRWSATADSHAESPFRGVFRGLAEGFCCHYDAAREILKDGRGKSRFHPAPMRTRISYPPSSTSGQRQRGIREREVRRPSSPDQARDVPGRACRVRRFNLRKDRPPAFSSRKRQAPPPPPHGGGRRRGAREPPRGRPEPLLHSRGPRPRPLWVRKRSNPPALRPFPSPPPARSRSRS